MPRSAKAANRNRTARRVRARTDGGALAGSSSVQAAGSIEKLSAQAELAAVGGDPQSARNEGARQKESENDGPIRSPLEGKEDRVSGPQGLSVKSSSLAGHHELGGLRDRRKVRQPNPLASPAGYPQCERLPGPSEGALRSRLLLVKTDLWAVPEGLLRTAGGQDPVETGRAVDSHRQTPDPPHEPPPAGRHI